MNAYVPTFNPADLGHAVPSWSKSGKVVPHQAGSWIRNGNNWFWISDLQTGYDNFVSNKIQQRWNSWPSGQSNHTILKRTLQEDDSWAGGPVETMLEYARGEIDLTPYQETRKKVSNIGADLEQYLQKSRPGRRRSFSSEDGDLCFDRRFEIEPFAACKKMDSLKIPRMTIVCDTSFSSGVDSEFINMHTAMAWAIVDMFESVGILCSVYSTEYGRGMAPGVEESQFIYELKRHDSYVSPNSIARGLCAGFFRRIIFNSMIEAADLNGVDVNSGLGRPNSPDLPLFKNGILYLKGATTEKIKDMVDTSNDSAAISRWLLKEMQPGLKEMGMDV